MQSKTRLYRLMFGFFIVLALVAGCGAPTQTAAPVQQPQAVAPAAQPQAPAPQQVPAAPQQQAPAAQPAFDMNAAVDKYISTLPDGFNGIAPAKLQEQMAAAKPFILDVREAKELQDGGFIEGAVNIPIRQVLKNLDKLPAKDQPIVVYCGIGHRGGIVLEALNLLGYTNVKSLSNGFTAWKEANLPVVTGEPMAAKAGTAPQVDAAMLAALDKYLSALPDGFNGVAPAKLQEQMAAAKPFILDVREAKELQDNGFIAGAVNIPMRSLTKSLDKLPQDKTAPIVVYCAIGHRGALALTALNLMGYTNVKSLSGGFNAWKKANLPVVTG
ncbi:MAG: rhodanese-like domain-containing protein [Anaerolineae bacterium]|nr:rhodanese-like domain-containing protein [Anaerolineae bacterium]